MKLKFNLLTSCSKPAELTTCNKSVAWLGCVYITSRRWLSYGCYLTWCDTLASNTLTTEQICLLHSNICHFHLFIRFIVSRVCRYIAYFLSDIHSLYNTTKHSVFVIKPRLEARKIQDAGKNRTWLWIERNSIMKCCTSLDAM